MRKAILAFGVAAIALTGASTATAQVSVRVGINPFVYGAYAPPVVYQPYPYYAPPPVVYLGGGFWAGDRGGHYRGHEEHGSRRR